jgi:hypothetical protein
MLAGVSAAAAGLIFGVAAKMAGPILRERFGPGPLVAFAAFVGVGLLRWPMPLVLAFLIPVSIALAWWVRR